MEKSKDKKLKKSLKLYDVFAISTGAMFSSGFFLLPGIAAAQTGSSVVLAYLVAGIFILPTMLSVAELSTAMPKAGGAYYFIDRSLGPLFGTIGGIGSWFALIFKSAFALIGMGAYIAIFIDLPITPVAIILTVVFGVTNIVGAKESSWIQNVLVTILISILTLFVFQGLFSVFELNFFKTLRGNFDTFLINGPRGFFATIGLVFVSYAGLTKVASVAEEVQNPDKTIPRGMILSLAAATFIYVVGVFIMVMLLDPNEFHSDLTPVATAAQEFMTWLPGNTGVILIVIAAIAAFASTANAGIMSASRYPLAMSRDKLIPGQFSKLGRFDTPAISTITTVGLMILLLLAFNVEAVAKLASAFQLLLFAILNVSVIVMRESKIEAYDPGFKSPFYPWVQISGFFVSAYLIFEMGFIPIIFTLGVVIVSVVWFFRYAKKRVKREGAIYHVHARLGEMRYDGLDREMQGIVREKGLRKEDPYEKAVSKAFVLDYKTGKNTEKIAKTIAENFSERTGIPTDKILDALSDKNTDSTIPMGNNVTVEQIKLNCDCETQMALVRIKSGVNPVSKLYSFGQKNAKESHCIIFLLSALRNSGQHLRILSHLADITENSEFKNQWLEAENEAELKEVLLRDELFISLTISKTGKTNEFDNKQIMDLDLPGESLITIIKRDNEIIFPHGKTVLQNGDRLSIIGQKKDINKLREQYKE